MKVRNLIILGLIMLLGGAPAVQAVNLFDWRLGARPMALAGAYSAVGGEVESISWNPAGLSLMPKAGITAGYISSFGEVSHYYLAGAAPALYGVLGAYVVNAGLGSIPVTTVGSDGRPVIGEYYSDTQWLVGLGYSQEILTKGLNVGGTFKGYQHKMYNYSTSGFGLDLGAIYDLSQGEILSEKWPVTLGLTAVNVLQPKLSWESGWSDAVSRRILVGAAYQGAINDNPLILSASVNPVGGSPKLWGVGAEYFIAPYLPVRLGYGNFYGTSQLALGVGLVYRDWGVDAAYKNHPDLGSNFQIALNWKPDFRLFSMKPPETVVAASDETAVAEEEAAVEEITPAEAAEEETVAVEETASEPMLPPVVETKKVAIEDVLSKATFEISPSGQVNVYVRLKQPYYNVEAVSFVTGAGKISLARSGQDDLYWTGRGTISQKFDKAKVFVKLTDGTVLYHLVDVGGQGSIASK